MLSHIPAGFPSPCVDYFEGRIDLNRELIKHPLTTFYMRVVGDSMIDAGIHPGALLLVDRAEETRSGHIVVARVNNELCVKQLCIDKAGKIWLLPRNDAYQPIEITEEMDFEVWGRVMISINFH